MDHREAKDTYEEAGRLFAEKRHADALVLLERLAEAFPTQTEVMVALAKCLIELGRHEDATITAQFIQDSLHDPRGAELLQSMPPETTAPPELPLAPAEQKPKRLRTVALALAGVGLVGGLSYYFLMSGNGESRIVEAPAASTQANAPSATLPPPKSPTSPPADAPKPSIKPQPIEQAKASPRDTDAQPLTGVKTEGHQEVRQTIVAGHANLTTSSLKADAIDQNEKDAAPPELAKLDHSKPVAALQKPPGAKTPQMSLGETLIELVNAEKLEDAVELLRNNRELANTLDYENRPVLTHAKSVDMAKLLVEAGADYERTTAGWTPLMWIAGRRGSAAVAMYLIDLGAWVSIEDVDGMRPIHHAAFMGSHDLVEAFVEKGADINAISDDYITPLHGAAFYGDVDGVKRYLLLGADPSAQNKDGETPYDTAKVRGNNDLLPLLDPAATVAEVAKPAKDQIGTAGTRDLQFSSTVKLGTIQIREWGSTDYTAWESAGSAWRTVSVPVGQEVMVMVNIARLDSLESIGAADIQTLYIRNVEIDDAQLKHLYHLKGLQRITLSRTGVSKEAIEALQAALPECTIRE